MTDQEKFHYTLPEDDGPSRWDGLSQSAREAVTYQGLGESPADVLLPRDKIPPDALPWLDSPEAREWVQQEIDQTVEHWRTYSNHDGFTLESTDELVSGHLRYAQTVQHLWGAREALAQSGEIVPATSDVNIAESMHLVLVPWKGWQEALWRFNTHMEQIRVAQRGEVKADSMHDSIVKAAELPRGQSVYRNPDKPTSLLNAREYLGRKIEQDGPWGIMLAQTSEDAGIKSIAGHSAANLTKEGEAHYTIEGVEVDAMGIFEWLSLSLQEDPRQLSSEGFSLLLANRFRPDAGMPLVPSAGWSKEHKRVETGLRPVNDEKISAAPRLAVLL